MSTKKKRRRYSWVGWFSAGLSRKMIFALLAVAILGWLLTCSWFLGYLRSYVGKVYDTALVDAEQNARQVGSFLQGSQGNLDALRSYLEERQLYCTVRDETGTLLLEYLPADWEEAHLAVSGDVKVFLNGGSSRQISVWSASPSRQALVDSIGQHFLIGLFIFNITLFLLAAVLIYLLLVAPIVRLRKTMRAYYERGILPERSQRLDDIGKLQNTFAELIGVLTGKEKMEQRLIASISHDIKTPLTSVMGYSERLLSAELPVEKQRQYLHSIYDKALNIKSIVDEFDDYLEAGLRDGDPLQLVTTAALCDSLRAEYEAELQDANVCLTVSCTCPKAEFYCNPAHMRRYFGNLIGNSIQHNNTQGLLLDVVCRQEEDQVILEFGDNGRGVEPGLLQQIFEPFYTSDRGRKVSGLGLSICKSVITAHGGTVEAENRPEGGLLIRAALPCAAR